MSRHVLRQAPYLGRSVGCAIILMLTWLQAGRAQDVCFYLQDRYGNWLRDCRAITSGVAPTKTICYGPREDPDASQAQPSAYRTQVSSPTSWKRAVEGQEGCTPCAYQFPIEPGGKTPIRGSEDARQEAP